MNYNNTVYYVYIWYAVLLESQKEFLDKYNMGKKFDICLMNPPYGTRIKNEPLHFKFTKNCNCISNKNIVVMPIKIIYATSERDIYWKNELSHKLISIEEVNSKVFSDTAMKNVGIYVFDNNKASENINISLLGLDPTTCKNLTELNKLSKIEENILDILNNKNIINVFNLKVRSHKGTLKKDCDIERTNLCDKFSKKKIYNNKIFLSCNASGWSQSAHFFSKTSGNIFNNWNDILNDWINNDLRTIKYIAFNSNKEAKNCKIAMQNAVLRFALYKIQDDQNMNNKCYRYIPNIDWSDDRVKTDEGLLELCGCPKDKIKEYADYCKEIIKKVDNGERP